MIGADAEISRKKAQEAQNGLEQGAVFDPPCRRKKRSGGQQNGDPAEILAGLPRPPDRSRNDKPEFKLDDHRLVSACS